MGAKGATAMALAEPEEVGPNPVPTIPPARSSIRFSMADIPTALPFSFSPKSLAEK
jgi:hypothetical protein